MAAHNGHDAGSIPRRATNMILPHNFPCAIIFEGVHMAKFEDRYSMFYRSFGFDIRKIEEAVESLPENIDKLGQIDLESANEGDVLTKTEGKWVAGKLKPGTEPVPLGNYYTKDEANNILNKKADIEEVQNLYNEGTQLVVENYLDKNAVTGLLDQKAPAEKLQTLEQKLNAIDAEEIGAAPLDHDHNDIYYEKFEIDDFIINKFNALSNKVDGIRTPTLEDLGAADANHNHNSLYYSKAEVDESIETIDNKISNLQLPTLESLGAAPTNHNHDNVYAKISDLTSKAEQSDLDSIEDNVNTLLNKPNPTLSSLGAAPANHDHNDLYYSKSFINDLQARVVSVENRSIIDSPDDIGAASLNHNHSISQITGLQDVLTSKAATTDLTSLTNRVVVVENRADFVPTSYYTKSEVEKLVSGYPLSEYGFHTITNPLPTATNSLSMTNGKQFLTKMYVPAGNAINKIFFNVRVAGSLPGAATSGVAIFNDTGTKLDSVLNNALFTSIGWKTATLTAPIAVQSTGKFYWIGVVCNFSTIPALYSNADSGWNGGGISTHRRNISLTATTTFATSFTPASYGTNEAVMPLIALGS